MPAPLSLDLRRRVIAAWQNGEGTWDAIAARFSIGVATVDRLVRQFRARNALEPLPHGGGVPHKIDADGLAVVRRLLAERSDLTDDELVYAFKEETGISVSPATMGRAVRRLGFTRKKVTVPSERDRPSVMAKRAEFLAAVMDLDPSRLVFIDESGSNISMTREYGRSLRGERIVERVPRNRGVVTTMIGALARDGLRALMTNEGGTSKMVFMRFLREHLLRTLRRGDVVVMDNLGAHHADGVREAVESVGASVLYLPAYSPDLNPIEECWSKVKYMLKTFAARTVRELLETIEFAKTFVTAMDAEGWFRHSGYLPNQAA